MSKKIHLEVIGPDEGLIYSQTAEAPCSPEEPSLWEGVQAFFRAWLRSRMVKLTIPLGSLETMEVHAVRIVMKRKTDGN